jgi:hypothetical protein
MTEKKHVGYFFLVGKPERKEVTWKTRRRWEGNTKMTLKENRREGVDWFKFGSGEGQMAGCCEHSNETSGSIKCGGEFLD